MPFRFTVLLLTIALAAHAQGPGYSGGPIGMASTELIAPVAGRGDGAQGSFWITDLWVRCPLLVTVTLEFHPMDSPSAAPLATATVTMTQPVIYFADVIKSQFHLDSGFGSIVIRGSNPVVGTIRTYTKFGSGAYGSAFTAMPSSLSMGYGGGMMTDDDEHRYYLQGILPEPQFRTNVMITNTGSVPIAGTVEILDADGSDPLSGPKSLPFSIQGYSAHQFNDVLAGVTSRYGDGTGLQIRIEMDGGTRGMMLVLGSVTDNTTNDTYTIMGSMMGVGGRPGMM
ncbi:MAG TPA: hypothetical protein VKH35_12230 [Thermoanaerobaculia bacterium]|nr:hypothetical protein [Thermoanaerobaculia bacterium]